MTLGADIRSFCLNNANLQATFDGRYHQGHVPKLRLYPYMYYERFTSENVEGINEPVGTPAFSETFLMVIVSEKPDDTETGADVLRKEMHRYKGQFGSREVQRVWLDENDDSYSIRQIFGEVGLHLSAFDVEITSR